MLVRVLSNLTVVMANREQHVAEQDQERADRVRRTEEPTKRRLPELSTYSREQDEYLVWSIEARQKIKIDAKAIGTEEHQFAYLYSRMAPKAQRVVAAWFEENSKTLDPEKFLRHLDSIYVDPNAAARALSKLSSIRQSSTESFATFLPKFERLLHEAKLGTEINDRVAQSFLEHAITIRLREAMISHPEYGSLAQYINALSRISSRLEAIRWAKERGGKPALLLASGSSGAQQEQTANDQMDWEPTKAGRFAPLDDHERDTLRREGKCFQCHRSGHIGRNCPMNNRTWGGFRQARGGAPRTTLVRSADPVAEDTSPEEGKDNPQE